MRILVIGCGRFGTSVIDNLSNLGHDVIAIDPDEDSVENVNNTMDAMAICASGTDYDALIEAEAGKASLCISCTNSDESTLLAAHLCKGMGIRHTIACVRDLTHGSNAAKFMEKSLDLDLMLNPDFLAAQASYEIIHSKAAKNVLILGGSVIAYHLSKMLIANGHKVGIIEKDESVCDSLANKLSDKVNIIMGDGAKHDVLTKEGLAKANAFVTLTGMDEVNILTSLFAKDQGVPVIITKVIKDSYSEIIHDLNLEHIVSPRAATINIIIDYVNDMRHKK